MKRLMKLILFGLAFGLCAGAASATTFYVQPNGGRRYDATYNSTGDSCNGQSNANIVVSGGSNQVCAWSDPRYTWANGSTAGGEGDVGRRRADALRHLPRRTDGMAILWTRNRGDGHWCSIQRLSGREWRRSLHRLQNQIPPRNIRRPHSP